MSEQKMDEVLKNAGGRLERTWMPGTCKSSLKSLVARRRTAVLVALELCIENVSRSTYSFLCDLVLPARNRVNDEGAISQDMGRRHVHESYLPLGHIHGHACRNYHAYSTYLGHCAEVTSYLTDAQILM